MAWISLRYLYSRRSVRQVVDEAGDEGAGAGGRVEDLDVVVGQGAPEVLLQQVVGAADDEVDDLVGGVDDAEAVGGGGVVGLVEVLVDGLEELLLFGVVGDLVGGAADGAVVGREAVPSLMAHRAGEEGLLQSVQLAGDVVLAVELIVVEDAEEDVAGEDVLEEHLADVGVGDVGADGLAAEGEEEGGGVLVVGVVGLGVGDGLAEAFEDGGEVGLELLAGLAELLDLGQFVVEEAADEAVEIAGAGHVGAHGLGAVLEEDGGLGVLEEDVVAGVAAVELGLDFGVEVVVGVLGLPVAAGHAEGVLDGAVGAVPRPWSGAGVEFVDQGKLLAVVAAVGVEADGEGAADALLVVGAAEVEEALEVGAVAFRCGGRRAWQSRRQKQELRDFMI